MKTYNSVKPQTKRQFVLDRLLEKGIIRSQQGLSIFDLDYEELKYELVLAAYREIDTESSSNSWF